jgi:hypothetical protein
MLSIFRNIKHAFKFLWPTVINKFACYNCSSWWPWPLHGGHIAYFACIYTNEYMLLYQHVRLQQLCIDIFWIWNGMTHQDLPDTFRWSELHRPAPEIHEQCPDTDQVLHCCITELQEETHMGRNLDLFAQLYIITQKLRISCCSAFFISETGLRISMITGIEYLN